MKRFLTLILLAIFSVSMLTAQTKIVIPDTDEFLVLTMSFKLENFYVAPGKNFIYTITIKK